MIASLNNEEMNNVLSVEEPNSWNSHVLCGNTGLHTTFKSNTYSGEEGVCIISTGQ